MKRYKVVYYDAINGAFTSIFSPPKYSLIYELGEITTAKKNTLGIMVFKRHSDAFRFSFNLYNSTILTVKPIGRGKTPAFIVPGTREKIGDKEYDEFYKDITSHYKYIAPPEGTICYPTVEVLND
jgi:hypothetical protein